jgi:hypothetical protein
MTALEKRVKKLEAEYRKIRKQIADLDADDVSIFRQLDAISTWGKKEAAWTKDMTRWALDVTDALNKTIHVDGIDWACVAKMCPAPKNGGKRKAKARKRFDITPPQTGPDWPVSTRGSTK